MPRPTPRHYDIEHLFSDARPKDSQQPQVDAVRAAAKVFAEVILENVPPGPDQDDAIRHVRKAVMMANAAIALEGAVLRSEVLMTQLRDRVFARNHGFDPVEVHLHKADIDKLYGHAKFARESDSESLRRGVAGYVEGVPIVRSTQVPEGFVKVMGESSASEPIAIIVA